MDETTAILNKLMDVATVRQRVLANNLANINTPGFKRQDVRFQEALASAVEMGGIDQVKQVKPDIYLDTTMPARADGNTVSLEDEMSKMVQNNILFDFSAKTLKAKFMRIHSAIKGM